MDAMNFLGSNDLLILAALSRGDSYGYQILKRMRWASGGQFCLKEATLYMALSRLQRDGLVESYPGQRTHGKPRSYFRMTEAGRQTYRAMEEDWRKTQQMTRRMMEGGWPDEE